MLQLTALSWSLKLQNDYFKAKLTDNTIYKGNSLSTAKKSILNNM
jgi:hypothetical protein